MNYTEDQIFILALGALGLGMYLLYKGGDWTIDGAIYVARRFGISPLVIGFTIVAAGTSLPELIVSINANLTGSPGIAIGNVIGSNVANILLVIGATAFVATMHVSPRAILRDTIAMLVATFLMVGLMLYGHISQLTGGLMLVALVLYLLWQYSMVSKGKIESSDIEVPDFKNLGHGLLFLILGMLAIALGAEFLVRGAKVSAEIIGVPEDVIGLSVIALGTSLPELSTCIIAAMKRQSDIVIGNILGSNFFNIMMIIGVTALIKPIQNSDIAHQVVTLDIWVMLGITLLFTAILMFVKQFNRFIGIIFISGYVVYIGLIYAIYLSADIIDPNLVEIIK